MRGNSKRSPVISTYMTGMPGAHSAGANSAARSVLLPELAALGGVSIAAIAFASFWVESPEPDGHATAAADVRALGSTVRSAFDGAAEPGFSPNLDSSKFSSAHLAIDRRSKPNLPAMEESPPRMGLVRAEVAKPTRQSPSRSPAAVAASASERPLSSTSSAEGAGKNAVADCGDDCPGVVVDRARIVLDGRSTSPHEHVSDGLVETANDEIAGLGEDRSDVSAALIVDSSPAGELIVDAPATIGPTLVDAAAEYVPPPQGQGSIAIEGSAAPRLDGATAPLASVAAANSIPPRTRELQAANLRTAIAGHLERLEARYSSVSNENIGATEEVNPAKGQALSASDGASPSFEFHPNEVAASGLIIEDDELVAIKLGELVSLFEARLDRPLYVWMTSSASASKFVTPKSLAAAGIRASYDAGTGRVVLSVDED